VPFPATVIIPCRSLDRLTQRCVAECRARVPGPIIVVPDADAEEGPADPRITVLPSGPASPAAKRNLAARAAATEFLAFIDSDARPLAGWPARAVEILEQDASLGAVGGPAIPVADGSASRRAVANAQRSVLLSGPYAYRKRRAGARDCASLSSCNMILRRGVYLRVGGMDERFFVGEDNVFCGALVAAGLRLRFDPGVAVEHRARDLRGLLLQGLCVGAVAWREFVARPSIDFWCYLGSASLLIGLGLGWLLFFMPPLGWLYALVAALYGGACVVEAVRLSGRVSDIPRTFAALVVGSLAPGLGMVLSLFGLRLNPAKVYTDAGQEST